MSGRPSHRARPYGLDAREWQSRRRLLLCNLGWFTAGPRLFGVSALLETKVPFGVVLSTA